MDAVECRARPNPNFRPAARECRISDARKASRRRSPLNKFNVDRGGVPCLIAHAPAELLYLSRVGRDGPAGAVSVLRFRPRRSGVRKEGEK